MTSRNSSKSSSTPRKTSATSRTSSTTESRAMIVGSPATGRRLSIPCGEDGTYEIHITPSTEKSELTKPTYSEAPKVRFTKWKIRTTYIFLTIFLLLFVGAIVWSPTDPVRYVVLAIGTAVTAALVKLLNSEYRRNI